jgi:outer membrane protein assembly factor BamB
LTVVDVTNGREKLRVPNSWQEELAVSDGLVYFRKGQPLYCFDIKAGKLKWEQDKWTNREIVVSNGILVTRTANDDLCAFDANSGRELWDFVVGDRLFNPTVYKGRVYSNCQNRTIYGIDLKTGKDKFRLKLEKPEYLTGHFVIYQGLLICKVYLEEPSRSSDQDRNDGKYFIMAVDIETGKTKWKTQCQNFLFKPAVSEGIVILEFEESISALDVANGQQIWQKRMPGVNNQPLIIEGTVYVGCDDEFLYALDLKDGHEKWKWGIGRGIGRDRLPLCNYARWRIHCI